MFAKKEKGAVSLEACIVVPLFIFLMLFLYSFFVVFEARNEMGHVLLATTNSMAFDVYADKNLGQSGDISQLLYLLYKRSGDHSDGFSCEELWFKTTQDKDEDGNVSINATFENAIRARFVAYLTDGGTTQDADAILKKYHIVGGLDGVDFSGSTVEGSDLKIKINYEIEYEFQVFGLQPIVLEQSACSRIWNDGGAISSPSGGSDAGENSGSGGTSSPGGGGGMGGR